jgi:nucleoid DNA-binding protein
MVVNIFFDSIAAALKKGEKVTLPIGTLEVVDQTRARKYQWIRGRFRVIYKQRKSIQFTPSAQCLKQLAGGG